MLDVYLREINCNCMHILLRESYFISIVELAIESIQNKNTITLIICYIQILHIVDITIIFNFVIISIKELKLITTYSMLYDICNYHILHYSKLITVHHITTVLIIVNLTSKNINNSCVLL